MTVGIIVGLVPGLHSNLVAATINNNETMAFFLFSMILSSNVFEFISTCYLGVPEEGEVLVKSPFHKLVLDGRSLVGIKVAGFSVLMTYSVMLIVEWLLRDTIEGLFTGIRPFGWAILVAMSLHLILKERKTIHAIIFFTLSGMLGYTTFNIGLKDPFLPLLSGLFGLSTILFSDNTEKIPSQMNMVAVESGFIDIMRSTMKGIISSIIMAIVPSVSPSQVGLISEEFFGRDNDEGTIANIASINIADNLLSLMALITIGKGRSGTIEKIGQIANSETIYYELLFYGLLTTVISVVIMNKVAHYFSKKINILNSLYIKIGIATIILLLTASINGLMGIGVLIVATILGRECNKRKIRMTHLLGSLVIPTIMYYL